MKRPVNQLAPADLPVPPGSREYLIRLGLLYVEQCLAAEARKSLAKSEQAIARLHSELEARQ